MKSITVRDVPDEVVEGLHRQAKLGRRSVQAQIRIILDREVRMHNPEFPKLAARWRRKMKSRRIPDSVKELRALRES